MGDWSRAGDEILTALAELYGYLAELIKVKQAQPGDDLLTALIAARDSGDRLSEDELVLLGCTLLLGGYETTPRLTGTRQCSATRTGSTSAVSSSATWDSAGGFHHCLGAQLAPVELQEALGGLVTRLPGLALRVPASELRLKPGMAIHNLAALPVTWTG